ncbi:MAG: serine/threonine-protein kinase [Candidatus Thiodiazotropha sp.]
MDGKNTFEELKIAANLVALNSRDGDLVDFLSTAHSKGLLSDNHYQSLINDISAITQQTYTPRTGKTPRPNNTDNATKQLKVLNDRFVLGPIIGKGGMGVVYKARDLRKTEVNDKDDIVAIKVLSSELRDLPKYLIALQREAKKAQILAHPNIVTVYDFDRDGDIAYMTMEYMDGVPLNKVINGRSSLPKKEAIRVIREIGYGLAYAHEHKIVHSDLKPGNIFLLKNGKIKILDFGIARAFHTHDEASEMTRLNDTQIFNAYTPAYASCEVIHHQPPTPEDDIYAFGCIAHELLTQTHPYARAISITAKEKGLKVKRSKYLTGKEYRAICHAVELNKSKRVASVDRFIRELTEPMLLASYLPNYQSKKLRWVVAALLIVVGVTAITMDGTITGQQNSELIHKEVGELLIQADNKLADPDLQQKNQALTLYKKVLKLDPENSQARSGLEKVKKIYVQKLEDAINTNRLMRANELLQTLEGYFGDQYQFQHLKQSLSRHSIASKIERLVREAVQQEVEKSYVRPKNINAYDTYLEILKISPTEPRALKGIERIRNKLISEAQSLLQKNQLISAEAVILDALKVLPKSQQAIEILNKIIAQSSKQTEPSRIQESTRQEEKNRNPEQQQIIQMHKNLAQKFINEGYLYGAGRDNAAYHYAQILTIEPSSGDAKRGLRSAWSALLEDIERKSDLHHYSAALYLIEQSMEYFSPYYDVKQVINELSKKRAKHLLIKSNKGQYIAQRLTQAKMQLNVAQLVTPEGNNALESYLEITKLDPTNAEARKGLDKVETKLLLLIKSYINNHQVIKANETLGRALEIFPESKKLNDINRLLSKEDDAVEHNGQDLKQSNQVTQLLNRAIVAFKRKRNIFPVGRSAYDYYLKIIALQPGSEVALQGLRETKGRVYTQIEADIKDKNYKIAHLAISRLLKLGDTDERLHAFQIRIAKADQSYINSALKLNNPANHLVYLLDFASQQEKKGVLWPPQSDNAYGVYKHVRDIEPLNRRARESLSKLFNLRIKHINNLLENNHLNEAKQELDSLKLLYAGHKEQKIIFHTMDQLNALKTSDLPTHKSKKL